MMYEIVQVGSAGIHADTEMAKRFSVLQLTGKDVPADIATRAADARVLVTSASRGASRELMASLPALEAVCNWGVGTDKVDVAAAREMGIAVSSTPDVLNDCVADLAFALMLAAARRTSEADRFVKAGEWRAIGDFPETIRVSGKRLGILGMGRIGEAIARRGAGFDMAIGYHNRSAKEGAPGTYFADLEELARWADFLVIACPGGEATRHIVNAAVLDALGPRGIVVNIARGTVIDEAALVTALVEGRVGGAGLDVLENEPAVPDALKSLDQVVLTPHIGSCTRETRYAMSDLVLRNVVSWMEGRTLVTPVP